MNHTCKQDDVIKEISIKVVRLETNEAHINAEIKEVHDILTKIYYAMLAGLGSLVILLFGIIADMLWKVGR